MLPLTWLMQAGPSLTQSPGRPDASAGRAGMPTFALPNVLALAWRRTIRRSCRQESSGVVALPPAPSASTGDRVPS